MNVSIISRSQLLGRNWMLAAAVLPLLNGCQTDGSSPPSVSLEEAKSREQKAEGERDLIAAVLREKEAQVVEKGVLLDKLKKDMLEIQNDYRGNVQVLEDLLRVEKTAAAGLRQRVQAQEGELRIVLTELQKQKDKVKDGVANLLKGLQE